MMFPALLMPHTYLAHFLSASLTGGNYNVAHLPTSGDLITILEAVEKHKIKNINELMNILFVTKGSNI